LPGLLVERARVLERALELRVLALVERAAG